MRQFSSYGPVNEKCHFCVPRQELVENCVSQLTGASDEGGHYFTIWAPRQTGKTWLMRQARKAIEERSPEQFIVGTMGMQGVIMEDDDPPEKFLKQVPLLLWETFRTDRDDPPRDWQQFQELFTKKSGLFERPVILFIDEFDALPRRVIDQLVSLFRDMYLKWDSYQLHGPLNNKLTVKPYSFIIRNTL